LKESSVEKVIATYSHPAQIPKNNIALMNKLGKEKLQKLINRCFEQ
jgi:hypothetical protein